MLQAILLVLKIILWIVLVVLGILLLLILLVLFAPIKYRVDVKYKDKAKILAKVNFLILSVRVNFDQEIKKLDYVIRVAGIKLNLDGKNKKTKKQKKPKKTKKNKTVTQDTPETSENAIQSQIDIVEEDSKYVEQVQSDGISEDYDTIDITEEYEDFDLWDNDIEKDVPKEQLSVFGRIKAFVSAIAQKIKGIKKTVEEFDPDAVTSKIETKINKLKKNINKFKKFWNIKCTVKTRKYLKKYLIGLVKHIGPRKIKGYVRYGFGDPCKTGQITGYLSLLPFVYSKDFSLYPDFHDKVIEADILMKGGIRLGYIARIILNINIWRTIIVAKKIFKNRK